MGDWFSRRTKTERYGLAAILVLVMMLAPLKAIDFAQNARSANRDAKADLDTALMAAGRAADGSLIAEVEQIRTEVRDWSWQGDTVQVARVIAQEQIARVADEAGMPGAEVRSFDRLENAGEVVLAPIELTAPFTWTSLSAFLTGLEGTGKGFVLDEVELTQDRQPKVRVRLRAPLIAWEENVT